MSSIFKNFGLTKIESKSHFDKFFTLDVYNVNIDRPKCTTFGDEIEDDQYLLSLPEIVDLSTSIVPTISICIICYPRDVEKIISTFFVCETKNHSMLINFFNLSVLRIIRNVGKKLEELGIS